MIIEDNVITETWELVEIQLQDAVPKQVNCFWQYTGGNHAGIELHPKQSRDGFPLIFITHEDVPTYGDYECSVDSFMFAVGYYSNEDAWHWDGTQSVTNIIVNEQLDVKDANPIRHNNNGYSQADYLLPSDRINDHNKWAIETLIDVVNGYIRA